jgi:hypothetical protein
VSGAVRVLGGRIIRSGLDTRSVCLAASTSIPGSARRSDATRRGSSTAARETSAARVSRPATRSAAPFPARAPRVRLRRCPRAAGGSPHPCRSGASRRRFIRPTTRWGRRCRSCRTAALVRAEIPVALEPAHRRRIERRQQCRPRSTGSAGLQVGRQDVPDPPVEVDLDGGEVGERPSDDGDRRPEPPLEVRRGARRRRSFGRWASLLSARASPARTRSAAAGSDQAAQVRQRGKSEAGS